LHFILSHTSVATEYFGIHVSNVDVDWRRPETRDRYYMRKRLDILGRFGSFFIMRKSSKRLTLDISLSQIERVWHYVPW
jgi:hypothetical protein